MKVPSLLYCYLLLTKTLSLAKSDYPTPLPPRLPLSEPFSASVVTSTGELLLTCSGYTRIPSPTDTSIDHRKVDLLDMGIRNEIRILKTAEFINAMFTSVAEISLHNCNIQEIESGAFRNLKMLMEVHFQYNRIESLNMDMFANNDNLRLLDLNGNPIHTFIGTQFPKLPLKEIGLAFGKITEIPLYAFGKLENLHELDLSHNKIRGLNWITFQNFTKLTQLHLEGNEWKCDCHMKFLQTFLKERKIDIAPNIICKGPGKFAKMKLSQVSQEGLTCTPEITGLGPSPSSTFTRHGVLSDGDLVMYSETGKDVKLNCFVEGHPQPGILWMKNNRPIDEYDGTISKEAIDAEDIRSDFKYRFTQQLHIFNTSQDDIGNYKCIAYQKAHPANRISQSVFLNLTNLGRMSQDKNEDDQDAPPIEGNGVWFWIFVAALAIILSITFFAGAFILTRRKKQCQTKKRADVKLRKAMLEKISLPNY